MNCTLCGTLLIQKIDKEYYDCPTCRALVKDEDLYPTPEKEKARYEEHNNDVNDIRYQKFTSPITNFVLRNLTPDHRGLDYGSGSGPVISKVLMDNHYQIAQYDPFFAPFPELLTKQYHYIVCCEVIEHFFNPKQEFEKLRAMLKNGGFLLCMTLLYDDISIFKTWHYRNDLTHVFIYRKPTIEYIAKEFGFEICTVSERLIIFKKP